MGLAQDLAPHLHARGMDIFVAHWSLSCCLTVTVGPAAARAAAAFPQRSPDGVRSRRTARPRAPPARHCCARGARSEEHTSELQSLMRISYAVFYLKNKN